MSQIEEFEAQEKMAQQIAEQSEAQLRALERAWAAQEAVQPGMVSDQVTIATQQTEVPQHVEVRDGKDLVVYGNPARDGAYCHQQGKNDLGFQGDCGLVSCQDVLRQHGLSFSENDIVTYADQNHLCDNSQKFFDPGSCGGTRPEQQVQILKDAGVPAHFEYGGTIDSLAAQIQQGRSVIVEVNSDTLWKTGEVTKGGADHAVVVTSVYREVGTGKITGFAINDSGDGIGNKFIDVATMEKMWVHTTGRFGPGCCVVTDTSRQFI